MKCDKCDKPAVVHEVLIKNGKTTEIHLCGEHAAASGLVVQPAGAQLEQVLKQFVTSHAMMSASKGSSKTCPDCGTTFASFRKSGTLGCARCYDTFLDELGPLVERAQNGATNHIGRTPARLGSDVDRQLEVRRLLRELDLAVAAEQYERAAQLRDRLNSVEPSSSSSSRAGGPGSPQGSPEGSGDSTAGGSGASGDSGGPRRSSTPRPGQE